MDAFSGLVEPQFHANLIQSSQIPRGVKSIVRTLRKNGFDAKIVGGCIRDLLLGTKPKDFDVVTDARPEQIRNLFDDAKVIGRRFKLVHIKLNSRIHEVSTYRRPSKTPGTQAKSLNRYGSIQTDFALRDFSVNAMYYDLESEMILDYTDGLNDLKRREISCIGPANEKLSQDPCRILRAIRFAAKLPLEMSDEIERSIQQTKSLISEITPRRLRDELQKLFLNGHAVNAFNLLSQHRLTHLLFPASGKDHRLALKGVENTDARVARNQSVTFGFLLAAIHWNQFSRRVTNAPNKDPSVAQSIKHANQIFTRQRQLVFIPGHMQQFVTDTWVLQAALERNPPKRVERLLERPRFRAGYDLLLLRSAIGDVDKKVAKWWTDLQQMSPKERQKTISALSVRPRKRRRRRRKSSSTPELRVT